MPCTQTFLIRFHSIIKVVLLFGKNLRQICGTLRFFVLFRLRLRLQHSRKKLFHIFRLAAHFLKESVCRCFVIEISARLFWHSTQRVWFHAEIVAVFFCHSLGFFIGRKIIVFAGHRIPYKQTNLVYQRIFALRVKCAQTIKNAVQIRIAQQGMTQSFLMMAISIELPNKFRLNKCTNHIGIFRAKLQNTSYALF